MKKESILLLILILVSSCSPHKKRFRSHVVKTGKTPMIFSEEARTLQNSEIPDEISKEDDLEPENEIQIPRVLPKGETWLPKTLNPKDISVSWTDKNERVLVKGQLQWNESTLKNTGDISFMLAGRWNSKAGHSDLVEVTNETEMKQGERPEAIRGRLFCLEIPKEGSCTSYAVEFFLRSKGVIFSGQFSKMVDPEEENLTPEEVLYDSKQPGGNDEGPISSSNPDIVGSSENEIGPLFERNSIEKSVDELPKENSIPFPARTSDQQKLESMNDIDDGIDEDLIKEIPDESPEETQEDPSLTNSKKLEKIEKKSSPHLHTLDPIPQFKNIDPPTPIQPMSPFRNLVPMSPRTLPKQKSEGANSEVTSDSKNPSVSNSKATQPVSQPAPIPKIEPTTKTNDSKSVPPVAIKPQNENPGLTTDKLDKRSESLQNRVTPKEVPDSELSKNNSSQKPLLSNIDPLGEDPYKKLNPPNIIENNFKPLHLEPIEVKEGGSEFSTNPPLEEEPKARIDSIEPKSMDEDLNSVKLPQLFSEGEVEKFFTPKIPNQSGGPHASGGHLSQSSSLNELVKALGDRSRIRVVHPEQKRYFGNQFTLEYLLTSSNVLYQIDPQRFLEVSDISGVKGGKIRPHKSHRNGLDMDVGFLFKQIKNGAYGRSAIAKSGVSSSLDRAVLWSFFKNMMKLHYKSVNLIFIHPWVKQAMCLEAVRSGDIVKGKPIDPLVKQTLRVLYPESGHYNHFHVRLRCPQKDKLCSKRNEVPLRPVMGCFGKQG